METTRHQHNAGTERAQQHALENDRLWKPGQSANPSGTRVPKRALALFTDFAPEFGGDAISTSVRAELMHACILMSKAERTEDCEKAAKAGNAARHILESLRRRVKLDARPPVQPLRERLAAELAAEEAEDEVAA
ncbi:MAG: hypothetical protein ACLQJ0_09240 [Steroidobacteraceae bacterium]